MISQVSSIAEALSLKTDAPDNVADPASVVQFGWVPISSLFVDQSYQRFISEKGRATIRKIVSQFEWPRFGALSLATEGDDRYLVLDGQHRAIAAHLAGAQAVPAMISRHATVQQAEGFVAINATRTSVQALDKYRARVVAGDPNAVEVAAILTELEIDTDIAAGTKLKPRQTRAVSALEKLVKNFGRAMVFNGLELLLDAQPQVDNLLTRFAIEVATHSVARVINAEGDMDRLLRVLQETDFETLKEQAAQLTKMRGGQTTIHAVDQVMHDYNKGLHKRIA